MKAREFLNLYEENPENRFKVIEYPSGYAVQDTETGKEAWMSDGVDQEFNDFEIGTEEFRQAWEDSLNYDPDETLDVYFPEQWEKEHANEGLLEWHCPKCGNDEIPDENRECPKCKYSMPKELNDKIREVYSKIYNKVFSKIRSKLMEDELQGTNILKFVGTLTRLGILQRLRSGRLVEVLRIPKELVIGCFVEGGKHGMQRLRQMAWRRKKALL